MFIRLGRPSPPEDAGGLAAGLLLECHARIRTFLDLAARLPQATPGSAELAEAAAQVARYFGEALPLHARDEEESVLPRLRGREPALDAELARMEREHRDHEPSLRALVESCAALAREPARLGDRAPAVAEAARTLRALFADHLRREEELVFPALRRLLDAEADAAIVAELRARRAPRP